MRPYRRGAPEGTAWAALRRSRRGRGCLAPSSWARAHRQSARRRLEVADPTTAGPRTPSIDEPGASPRRGSTATREGALTATRHSCPMPPARDPYDREAMTSRGDQGKRTPSEAGQPLGGDRSPRGSGVRRWPAHRNLHDDARRATACKIPRTTTRNFYRISTTLVVEMSSRCRSGNRPSRYRGPSVAARHC